MLTVAVKRINTESDEAEEIARREAKFLARLVHCTHVVRLHAAYRNARTCTLYLELCETDLHKWIRSRSQPPGEAAIRSVAQQVARGIDAIHSQGIVHRDIKLSNLLLKPNRGRVFPFDIKLSDFGLASEEMDMRPVICGTPRNMAPEVFMKRPTQDRMVDIYSFGTVLYEIHTKAPPVRASSLRELKQKFSLPTPPTKGLYYPANTSPAFKHLCDALLRVLPSERPSINSVLDHPFLAEDESSDTFVMIAVAPIAENANAGAVDEAIRVVCALRSASKRIDVPSVRCAVYRLALDVSAKGLADAKEGGRTELLRELHARLITLSGNGPCDNEVGQAVRRALLNPLESMRQIASDNKQYKVADAIDDLITEVERVMPSEIECSKMLSGAAMSEVEIPTASAATSKPIAIPGRQHRFCFSCGTRFTRQDIVCSCGETRGFSC